MRLIKIWLLRSLSLVLAFLVIIFIAVALLLSTESGTRWALDRANAALMPAELDVAEFSGSLWSGLSIPTLIYRDESQQVDVQQLELSLDWVMLSTGQVTIDRLTAHSVTLTSLSPAATEAEPFELSMEPIPARINVRLFAVDQFVYRSGDDTTVVDNLRGAGVQLYDTRISIDTADLEYTDVDVSLSQAKVRLAGNVPLSADVSWQLSDAPWAGQAELRGSLLELEFRHLLRGDLEATASGTARVLHEVTPLVDATIRWQEWVIADYRSSVASIHVLGSADDYQLEYRVSVEDAAGRSADVEGIAQGNLLSLQSLQATVESVIGKLAVDGDATWSPTIAANVNVRAAGLDFSGFDARFESALDVDVSIRVQGEDYIGIDIHSVKGTYAELDAAASGKLENRAAAWLCSDCLLQLGANRLSSGGSLNDQDLDFTWAVDASALAELWPGLAGNLQAKGGISGTIDNPRVAFDASATDLSFLDGSIHTLVVHAEPSTLKEINLSFSASQISYAEQQLGDLALVLGGDLDKQLSTINWVMDEAAAEMRVATAVNDSTLSGVLEQGSVTLPTVGTWLLQKPATFNVASDNSQLGQQTWRNADSNLTIQNAVIADGNLTLKALLEKLPLSLLASYVPQGGEVFGTANATIDLRQSGEEWFGQVDGRLDDTVIRVMDAEEETINIAVPKALLGIELLGKGAKVNASVAITPGLNAEMQFELSTLDTTANIDGRIQLKGDDWYWVPAMIPALDGVEGVVAADISARGALLKPALSGELTVTDGALLLPSLNVPLQGITIRLSGSDDGSATLVGSMKAGSGDLVIDGKFSELFLPTRQLEVHVSGKKAEVINWPEYRAWATPDITLRSNEQGWTVGGSVEIPRAEIAIREIPEGSVPVSPDVTVLGRSEAVEKPLPISGELSIVLGKAVHFQAMGLDTRIEGSLIANMPRTGEPELSGRLNLREGKFAAYGQKLAIENGSLTFTGPIDDPIVDVRAGKIIESVDGNVEAGIELRGRAQNLVSAVYSVPKMAEADALSYLVLGRPLEQASSSDGNQLNNAALALGLGQATRITNQVGQKMGLDQLSVSGGSNETAALIAGKQLNSRLYVRYAYGVFSQLGTLLMRYRLSKRLTLEAGSAEGQSMELLYTVEKP